MANGTYALTVRMPDKMRERIRRQAAANHRSVNSEVVYHLDRALAAEEAKGPASAPTLPSHDQSHYPAKDGGIDA